MTEQSKLIETCVALYFALEYRQHCPNCGGKGCEYVALDDDVTLELCDCSDIAHEILEKFREVVDGVTNEYLKQAGLDPDTILAEWETLGYGILEYIRNKTGD